MELTVRQKKELFYTGLRHLIERNKEVYISIYNIGLYEDSEGYIYIYLDLCDQKGALLATHQFLAKHVINREFLTYHINFIDIKDYIESLVDEPVLVHMILNNGYFPEKCWYYFKDVTKEYKIEFI